MMAGALVRVWQERKWPKFDGIINNKLQMTREPNIQTQMLIVLYYTIKSNNMELLLLDLTYKNDFLCNTVYI